MTDMGMKKWEKVMKLREDVEHDNVAQVLLM